MKKITYIFGDGRINKLVKENEYAKDFYYGYHLMNQNSNYNTQILELHTAIENKDKGSKIFKVTKEIRSGVVWANTFNKFDPASPFGGYKESGTGSEGGIEGLSGYVNLV